MSETEEVARKRLTMRSWRRGMKEMDLILGPYAEACLAAMPPGHRALYEDLLGENDQDLYLWVSGAVAAPGRFAALIAEIAAFAKARHGIGV